MGARIPCFDKSIKNEFILYSIFQYLGMFTIGTEIGTVLSLKIPIITIIYLYIFFFMDNIWPFHVNQCCYSIFNSIFPIMFFIWKHHISGIKDARSVKV